MTLDLYAVKLGHLLDEPTGVEQGTILKQISKLMDQLARDGEIQKSQETRIYPLVEEFTMKSPDALRALNQFPS